MADLAADETRETPRATSARVSGTGAKADAGRAKRTPSVWSRSIGVRQGGRWHDATTTGRLSQCRQSPSLGGAMIDWRNGRRNSCPRPPPAPGGRPVTPDWRTSRYKLQSNHIPVILKRKRLYLNNYYIYKFITCFSISYSVQPRPIAADSSAYTHTLNRPIALPRPLNWPVGNCVFLKTKSWKATGLQRLTDWLGFIQLAEILLRLLRFR